MVDSAYTARDSWAVGYEQFSRYPSRILGAHETRLAGFSPLSAGEVCIHQLAGLIPRTRHQMAVARESLLDGRVTHELLNRLWVDPGIDQQRHKGVATLVERERRKKVGVAPLTTALTNVDSHRFYERHGFQQGFVIYYGKRQE